MKSNTINKQEIAKFSKIASEWWNPEGKFKPLHKFNPIRIRYIKDNIINHLNIKSKNKPLNNLEILDIGCGGGLLSEPMSRLGANVTGIDASEKNIKIAKLHSKKNKLKINYICSSPEKLKLKKKFDVILNMEIVEHVEDINFFIKKSSELLTKNGLMFVATLNKTLKSYVFAIIGAEYILKWLPIGSHFKIYSAPMIAKAYDFRVLFKVATNITPFFLSSFALSLIKKSISSTCSTISIIKITSNFILVFNFSGDATL